MIGYDENLITIYKRMLANHEWFTFSSLHLGLHEEAYRLADKTLQRFRRNNLATYRRDGRLFVWSLTPSGIEYVRSCLVEEGGEA